MCNLLVVFENHIIIFSDNECTKKLLFPLLNQNDMIIYRITTIPQSKDSTKFKELVGGNGTFVINPTLKGKKEHIEEPCQIRHISPTKGFVHVLNETSLKILTDELDTSEKAYVFIVWNQPSGMTYNKYVKVQEYMLYGYMMVVKSKDKYLKDIIGLARESDEISNFSYSLNYLDCSDRKEER